MDLKPYKIKAAPHVFREHMVDMLVLGLPFASLIFAGVFGYIPDEWFIPAYVAAAILISIALFRQMRRFSYFMCVSCGTRLRVDELEDGEAITFTCEQCRIIWKTDFHHSPD